MGVQVEKYLKEVTKGKYGETTLNQADVKLFIKRATKQDIKELEQDFIAEDCNIKALEAFVYGVIS